MRNRIAILGLGAALGAMAANGASAERFVSAGDGAIRDTKTGLVWEKAPDQTPTPSGPGSFAWLEASFRCYNRHVGQYQRGGWRLPEIWELTSLLNCREENLCLPSDMFDIESPYGYWSNTEARPNEGPITQAWGANLQTGAVSLLAKELSGNEPFPPPKVWCVR